MPNNTLTVSEVFDSLATAERAFEALRAEGVPMWTLGPAPAPGDPPRPLEDPPPDVPPPQPIDLPAEGEEYR